MDLTHLHLRSRLVSPALVAGLTLAACGTEETPDDKTAEDSGTQVDSSTSDTGSTADSSTVKDAGSATDDTAATDTGSATKDSGTVDNDTGTTKDAGSATTDTGSTAKDTGTVDPVDAGPAAVDAGPTKIDKYSEHSATCKTDKDCAIPCAQGQCSSGKCTFIPLDKTCLVELPGDKVGCYGEAMLGAKHNCLRCNPAISQSALTSTAHLLDLNGDTNGIKTEDMSKGGVLWTLSAKRAYSGTTSLYFGDPKTHLYANDKHVKATATTPDIAVPDFKGVKPELSFWLWLATEESKGYDFLKVEVVDGAKGTQIWHSDSIGGTTFGIWKNVLVPVDKFGGKTVKIRFTFDSIDGQVNAFEGAYIDDIAMKTGCCGSVSDCDDGNACSKATCAPGTGANPVCKHAVTKKCCNSAADCDDGKPCTVDICSGKGGTCTHSAKPGCCLTGADCDDKDSCTIDHCPGKGAQCQHTNTCCKADGECSSEDPCLVGNCTGGECAFTSVCCTADVDCDDFNTCTLDACDPKTSKCVHTPSKQPGCCSPVPWADSFENGVVGWKADAPKNKFVWHSETPKDASKVKTGAKVLKFGIPGQTYKNNGITTNYGYVVSPTIDLPAGQDAKLTINVLIDSTGSASYNRVNVYLYKNLKSYYIGYMTNAKKGWQSFNYDVSFHAGGKFQIRLYGRVGGYSSLKASGSGIYVDDMRVQTTCSPKKCTDSTQCKTPSKSTCRAGSCVNGLCQFFDACCKVNNDCKTPSACETGKCSFSYCNFTAKKGCCNGDGDCDDGNPCTDDSCPGKGKQCVHKQKAACCVSSSECNDGDKCTEDACIANECKNTNLCCKKDADCSDGETKCTTDTCGSNGFCVHKPTGAKGCCKANVYSNDFDKGSLGGIQVSNTGGSKKGWQLWNPAYVYKSPKGALYYGDPIAKNYNFGKSKGTATTGSIKLPSNVKTTLTLWAWLDTEASTKYDAFKVYLVIGTSKQLLYHKGSKPGFKKQTWTAHKYDLAAHKGKSVKVQFEFDSYDSFANTGKGVIIDDLKFTASCP